MTSYTKQTISFFNYPHVFKSQESEFLSIIRDVGSRGGFIMQRELADFEAHLAEFLRARHTLGVANATDGLMIALRASGLCPGDEVIICSHTMVATASAVHFSGGIPVPVESGPDHLMDSGAAESAITPRTRAIIPTQLNGRTCNMDALTAIAEKYSLIMVEDAAQALGSRYKGKCAGTFGNAAAISFYPAKVLGCLGDGGAVITNNDDVYERISELRDHGRNRQGEVVSWGLNSRLDNLQAAILDFQLSKYDQIMTRRRHLASLYTERLKDVAGLILPPAPDSDPDHFDIYQNYEIEAARRDALMKYLKEQGIGTLLQWGGRAIHQLESLGFTQHLPYTDSLFTRLLMLPMNMSLSDNDIDYVCDNVRQFYGYAR